MRENNSIQSQINNEVWVKIEWDFKKELSLGDLTGQLRHLLFAMVPVDESYKHFRLVLL